MRIDGPSKILLLTDSSANPRSFPAAMRVELEETYPYLLRDAFRNAVFYQLSFGNLTTEDLVSQAMAYLTHWAPDVIIVQSGLSDCRPEGFTEVEKRLLNALPGKFFGKLKRQVNNPKIIRRRQIYRISPASFRKTLKKFKMVFATSQIFWMEICVAPEYEVQRPGIARRLAEYNQVIADIYGDGYVAVQERLLEIGGFNGDHTHWLANAHKAAANLLAPRINAALRAYEAPALTLSAR